MFEGEETHICELNGQVGASEGRAGRPIDGLTIHTSWVVQYAYTLRFDVIQYVPGANTAMEDTKWVKQLCMSRTHNIQGCYMSLVELRALLLGFPVAYKALRAPAIYISVPRRYLQRSFESRSNQAIPLTIPFAVGDLTACYIWLTCSIRPVGEIHKEVEHNRRLRRDPRSEPGTASGALTCG